MVLGLGHHAVFAEKPALCMFVQYACLVWGTYIPICFLVELISPLIGAIPRGLGAWRASARCASASDLCSRSRLPLWW